MWQEVLDLVRGLDKDPFTRLLINWYRRAKGKYKVPTFAHQELDLHKVFWEVQDKGGYDQVTALKLWKVPHSPCIAPCHVTLTHVNLLCQSAVGLACQVDYGMHQPQPHGSICMLQNTHGMQHKPWIKEIYC